MTVGHPQRSRSHLWWAIWLALGLVLGAQALRIGAGNAFVRAGNEALAVAVRPQNGRGLALLASAQLVRGNVPAARAASRAALRRTPLAVVAVRTLAQAEAKLGAPGTSERAWQIASTMGWRDQPTQAWALVRAVSNGEAAIFAMRAEALFRIGDRTGRIGSVVRESMVEPAIRRAFVGALAEGPEWRLRVFAPGLTLSGRELDGAILTLRDLGAGPSPPQRQELRAAIGGLIAAKRYGDAVALDRRFVRRAPDTGSLIDDGGFDLAGVDYHDATTPFDWIIVGENGVIDESGRRSLVVNSAGAIGLTAVQRFVALAPGRYRLAFSTSGPRESPDAIGVRVHCAGSYALLGTSSREPFEEEGWQEREFGFVVPPGCGLAQIVIGGFAAAEPAEVLLDDFAISAEP